MFKQGFLLFTASLVVLCVSCGGGGSSTSNQTTAAAVIPTLTFSSAVVDQSTGNYTFTYVYNHGTEPTATNDTATLGVSGGSASYYATSADTTMCTTTKASTTTTFAFIVNPTILYDSFLTIPEYTQFAASYKNTADGQTYYAEIVAWKNPSTVK